MKLLVVSHKECWLDPDANNEYVTKGGFPFQIGAISNLFDQTDVMIALYPERAPIGSVRFEGHNMTVRPLSAPRGTGLRRKLALFTWFPRNSFQIWQRVAGADAIHAPVPGDIGSLGLIVALLQRKPLFVRHCGTWGEPVTASDRLLLWILERIAGGRNVVMATGGGGRPPSRLNPHITWIHSTTLTESELEKIPEKAPWEPGEPPQLATVGRLSAGKNMIDAIRAMPQIHTQYPSATLHIVGDGEERHRLEEAAVALGLGQAVVFHGNVDHDEVLRILQQCDLFVFPTKTKEGFPKAVLEALACGLPVITTNVSVLPYLIGRERGAVLDEVSAGAVAKAALDLLSDPARFAEMSRSAQLSAHDYTLERWQAIIAERLEAAWGQPLQDAAEER